VPALILALLLAAAPARAMEASKDTVDMVQAFLKLPIDQLPVEHIDEFIAVDPESLPKKLRTPFKARRLELYTLKQLHKRKKYGTIIASDEACAVPHEAKSGEVGLLRMVGYQEIDEEEKQWLEDKTKCTERDMLCEFTLQIVDETVKKKRVRHYYLYCKGAACDALFVLVGTRRAGVKAKQTNFFGSGSPVCTH
jgi:hypothetical protein